MRGKLFGEFLSCTESEMGEMNNTRGRRREGRGKAKNRREEEEIKPTTLRTCRPRNVLEYCYFPS